MDKKSPPPAKKFRGEASGGAGSSKETCGGSSSRSGPSSGAGPSSGTASNGKSSYQNLLEMLNPETPDVYKILADAMTYNAAELYLDNRILKYKLEEQEKIINNLQAETKDENAELQNVTKHPWLFATGFFNMVANVSESAKEITSLKKKIAEMQSEKLSLKEENAKLENKVMQYEKEIKLLNEKKPPTFFATQAGKIKKMEEKGKQ